MSKVHPVYSWLNAEIEGMSNILDIGVGHDPTLQRMTNLPDWVDALDIHEPSLKNALKSGIYTHGLLGDALELLRNRPDNMYDCVLMFDFIEHIDKHRVNDIIREAKRVAKKKVIVWTPNGFFKDNPLWLDNEYQAHRSGWTVDEFYAWGFSVRGSNGLKMFRFLRHFSLLASLHFALINWFVEEKPRISGALFGVWHKSVK